MKLILFDIDGTLLWTDGAGRRAIGRAVLDELGAGAPMDGYRLDGKTDPQIVVELAALAGHPEPGASRVAAVCRRYIQLLRAELAKAPHAIRPLPGVTLLLEALAAHEAAGCALVGLLTGNLAGGAELKLRAAGLDPGRFAVGAYGSDSPRRADLPAVAAARAADRAGRTFGGADIVIIGDTPDDVACARPIGARTIAVATGHYTAAQLEAAGAARVFPHLEDTARVVDALLS